MDYSENIKQLFDNYYVKVEDYLKISGFSDKYTLVRSLKRSNIECLKTKSMGFHVKGDDMFNFLTKKMVDVPEWGSLYIELYRQRYHKMVFRFLETEKKQYRLNLGNFVEIKGVFYDYSLTTLKIAEEAEMCSYEVYKLCNKRLKPSIMVTHFDNNRVPYVCFDSLDHNTRMAFIRFLDYLIAEHLTDKRVKNKLTAYKLAVTEMLDYQKSIDDKVNKRKVSAQDKKTRELKTAYREASKLYHPDVNSSAEAAEIMKQVNLFYEKQDTHSILNLINKMKFTV